MKPLQLDDDAGDLFVFAVDTPDGFTADDVKSQFGWDRPYFFKVVRQLRIILGDDDQINLVCDPQGSKELWLYRLVGTMEHADGWMANRLGDMESRIETMHAVLASIVSATDGRSGDGRKARLLERTLRHLQEDLEALSGEAA